MTYKRVLILEAMVHLAAALFAVSILPFGLVTRLLMRPAVARWHRCAQAETATGCIQGIQDAVTLAARWPFRWAPCLPQAIAAHWMLARRHIWTQIRFGVRRGPCGLCSHAWLVHGTEILLGRESVSQFSFVAEIPVWHKSREVKNVGDLGSMAAGR